MPKGRSRYVCRECGADAAQYFGKCPFCGSWNSMVEEAAPVASQKEAARRGVSSKSGKSGGTAKFNGSALVERPQPLRSQPLHQVQEGPRARFSSGYPELDRVLGGGIVSGSLVLVGGDPGIGKSTLLLQVAGRLSGQYPILYVCAEESSQQVKLRWQRLGVALTGLDEASGSGGSPKRRASKKRAAGVVDGADGVDGDAHQSATSQTAASQTALKATMAAPDLYLLPETDLDAVMAELETLRPPIAIIDSIQALYFSELTSAPGSVSQVRECTSALMRLAKRENITLLIVGHVTKEGAIAGPKVLEHLVDTVLYFEGDRFASHRLLRSVKNRFGATHELGIFEMADSGLTEVSNPSALFLSAGDEPSPGTATIVACEGTRPLLVELQALVSPTSYASPRRATTGIEYNRLLQILAVLEKRVGIPLSKLDAYVASSGGLNVGEPAADLGVAVAVAASFRDRIVDPETVLIGEVGLGGQVRPVSQMELRLREADKLGFRRAIVPPMSPPTGLSLDVIPVKRVVDAMGAALAAGGPQQVDWEED
ncbi:MAG: DNA repair protein RadA [Elainellaceae cyanobacterium]